MQGAPAGLAPRAGGPRTGVRLWVDGWSGLGLTWPGEDRDGRAVERVLWGRKEATGPRAVPRRCSYLFMEETLGTVSLSQMPSASSLSRISQANIVGFCLLYSAILSTTFGVATLGLEPPITPGLMLPVS